MQTPPRSPAPRQPAPLKTPQAPFPADALAAEPEKPSPGFTLRGLLWPLGLLTAGLITIIGLLLLFAAREQNRVALEASEHLAWSALAAESSELSRQARDYAYWDATVENLIVTLNETWAEDNVGTWAYEGLQIDASLVLDGQDQVVYAMIEGERLGDEVLNRITDGLVPLVDAARSMPMGELGIALTHYVRFDDGIAIASAAPIVWENGEPARDRGGDTSVLIYLRVLNSEMLGHLEHGFLLPGLRLVLGDQAPEGAILSLQSYEGKTLGYLSWSVEKPGFLMLRSLLLPGAIAALGVLLLLGIVIHRVTRNVAQLETSHAALEKQATALTEARDRAEEQAKTEIELRRKAVDASRAKSEFLALVSHELRTPLNAILGFSETIATQAFGQGVTDRYREYARDIHESGSHLLSIINDILDLTKVESGRYELRDEEIDLDVLLRRCVALLRERTHAKSLTLTCGDCGIRLRADSRAMKQIVFNLLSNAIKYTAPGGRIDLSASVDVYGVSIVITDNGIGMSEEDLSCALQPFGQAASALTRSTEGTGLGLNVTKALAELHGGRLIVLSAPGQGTTAGVRLPAARLIESPGSAAPAASA